MDLGDAPFADKHSKGALLRGIRLRTKPIVEYMKWADKSEREREKGSKGNKAADLAAGSEKVDHA